MPAANVNDKLKAKLDTLKETPEGFNFNSSATWQKLETRLQKKNYNQKDLVFKYAAVSVLLIILSLFVYKPSSERDTIRPVVVADKKPELLISSPLYETENKAQSLEKNIETKPHPHPTYNAHTEQRQKISTNKPEITTNIFQVPIDNNLRATEMLSDLPLETVIVTTTPTSKKRFKIAHINEVNQTIVHPEVGKPGEKNNYGFSLRKEVSFGSEDEKYQPVNHPVTKTKSIYSLLNSQ